MIFAQSSQIVAHIAIPPNLLLHIYALDFDQYWLQPSLVYGIFASDIDRDIGHI